MSDHVDITPTVKKQTKRFAPVKRGAKTLSASRSQTASEAVKTEGESSKPEMPKSTTIGTIRPEAASSGRLQSVNEGQKPRGSSIKMKFKPTVPLKRNKKEVTSSAIDEALNATRGGRGARGARGGGRGRGRGRGGIIIEEASASGIFSLGPSAVSRSGNSRPGYGGGASMGGDVGNRTEADSAGTDMTEMFTTLATHDTPVTFKHTSRMEGDVDPITLSQKIGKIPWMNVKSEKKKKEVKVKSEDDMDEDNQEPEETEESEDELKPVETLYIDSDSPAQNIFALDEKHRMVCVAEDELLYFQFPTIVPNFEAPKVEELEIKDEDEEKKEEQLKQLPPAARKNTLEEAMGNLDLKDMPQGQVGKLIIYKSGKMRMRFGNILMDVIQGMHSTFLENVMVVDHESDETKKAIELGHIVQKFVCSPNMDALLEQDEEGLK
ncbi:RNA polymerase III RPC4-domain-containing protein [Sporodiniella umbellata]|nr:RNA polymerase III RPC4-domain-containing protein [Sporodiniella umbellata]